MSQSKRHLWNLKILRIFDFSGKLCLESKLNSGTNNQILINIKPGIYIVQVISGSAISFVQKLISYELLA